jgi:hypothetical protein
MSDSIKENLVAFSESWGPYVQSCRIEKNGTEYFRNTKKHIAHKIFINNLPKVFMSCLDNKRYSIKSSLGDGNTAGIPWLCIMHKQVTDSVTDRFYISYLFSRNAKKVYLSIGIGATQFSKIYGTSINKCVPKINDAKNQFQNMFQHYAPNNANETMDLFDSSDTAFIRTQFSQSPKFKVAAYEAGCFFTKSYSLKEPLDENELQNDLQEYIKTYEKLIDDPISIPLIDNLAEIIYEKDNKVQVEIFDYDIPQFNPAPKEKRIKIYSPSKSKINNKNIYPRKSSKRVGDAGEEYVYKYEYKKLIETGREDLAKQIVKQYEDHSFFPGYDIKSFDENGNEIFIEVKSTVSKDKNYFEISDNEVLAADSLKDSFFIYQVTEALSNPRISVIIKNPMKYISENKILLEPWIYKMHIE